MLYFLCLKSAFKIRNALNHIENKKKPCAHLKLKMHQNAPKCTEKATKCTEKAPKCTGKNDNFINFKEEKEYKDTNKDYICNFARRHHL